MAAAFFLSRDGRQGQLWKDSGSGLNRVREDYPNSLLGGISMRAVVRGKEESGGWQGHVTYPRDSGKEVRERTVHSYLADGADLSTE